EYSRRVRIVLRLVSKPTKIVRRLGRVLALGIRSNQLTVSSSRFGVAILLVQVSRERIQSLACPTSLRILTEQAINNHRRFRRAARAAQGICLLKERFRAQLRI